MRLTYATLRSGSRHPGTDGSGLAGFARLVCGGPRDGSRPRAHPGLAWFAPGLLLAAGWAAVGVSMPDDGHARAIAASADVQPYASSPAALPASDCPHARTASQRLICTDPALAEQDRKLARRLAAVRATLPAQREGAFAAEANRNRRDRDHNCRDRACLAAWYAMQQAELEAWDVARPGAASR